MSLQYFTPGPTQQYPKLPQFLADAAKEDIFSISHRSLAFQEIFQHAQTSLRALLEIPEDFHILFLGSATEIMERLIENCVASKSVHFVNGAFSKRMYDCALELKKQPLCYSAPLGEGFELSQYTIPSDTELLCMSHCETSGCVRIPMEEISLLRSRAPHALLALDIVTTAPYAEIDFTQVDAVFFSIQKGFGLPAGMGVLIANDRIINKSISLQETNHMIGTYHNFPTLVHYEQLRSTPETPNILGIYLLGRSASDMLPHIQSIRSATREKAEQMYDVLEHHEVLRPFVQEKKWRSETVFGINTPWGSSKLIEYMKSNGYLIGGGYGEDKERLARIANFPMHSIEQMQGLIDSLRSFKV